jgi:hypothetical protein
MLEAKTMIIDLARTRDQYHCLEFARKRLVTAMKFGKTLLIRYAHIFILLIGAEELHVYTAALRFGFCIYLECLRQLLILEERFMIPPFGPISITLPKPVRTFPASSVWEEGG